MQLPIRINDVQGLKVAPLPNHWPLALRIHFCASRLLVLSSFVQKKKGERTEKMATFLSTAPELTPLPRGSAADTFRASFELLANVAPSLRDVPRLLPKKKIDQRFAELLSRPFERPRPLPLPPSEPSSDPGGGGRRARSFSFFLSLQETERGRAAERGRRRADALRTVYRCWPMLLLPLLLRLMCGLRLCMILTWATMLSFRVNSLKQTGQG